MSYPVKVEVQLVQLSQNVVIPCNFQVSIVDQVAGAIELCHGERLALLAEIVYLLLDLRHDTLEIAPQGC